MSSIKRKHFKGESKIICQQIESRERGEQREKDDTAIFWPKQVGNNNIQLDGKDWEKARLEANIKGLFFPFGHATFGLSVKHLSRYVNCTVRYTLFHCHSSY